MRMPNQPRNQKARGGGGQAKPHLPCWVCPPVRGGGHLAFSALSLGLVSGLLFIPLCHIEMGPLGVDRGSHEDQLFKKLPPIESHPRRHHQGDFRGPSQASKPNVPPPRKRACATCHP